MRFDIAVGAVALILTVAVETAGQQPKQRPREGTLKVGDAAPALAAEVLAPGTAVKLADLRGRPTVLVFGSCT